MNFMDVVLTNREAIIDIREPEEYAELHISGVKNIPMMGLLLNPGSFITKDERYYIMCHSGGRAQGVVDALSSQGYDVVNLGGIIHYEGE